MKASSMLAMAGVATVLCLGPEKLMAQGDGGQGGGRQGRGGFDPAQFQERRLANYRERLEITEEAEWKAIQPLVSKVMDAQTAVLGDRMRGAFGGRRGPVGGGDNAPGDQGGRRGGFGAPSPEAEALQKAIDSKAAASEVKAALGKLREARKERQAKLDQSQEELRKVLSARQEAQAVLAGLID